KRDLQTSTDSKLLPLPNVTLSCKTCALIRHLRNLKVYNSKAITPHPMLEPSIDGTKTACRLL
ncbi:MAG TPA: hypothetical protein VF884_09590, partial [Nitrososphaeraceae archaeon]